MRDFWTPAYIALGSNLDHPQLQVRHALIELQQVHDTRLIVHSSLYQSQPMGPQDQPYFVNAVAGVLTQLSAYALLVQLQEIEQRMGRHTPAMRWGPRVIDLDILMHGDTKSATAELQIPHPGMLTRNFVMTPLAEIAPHLVVSAGRDAAAFAQQLGVAGLQRMRDESHS